MFKTVGELLAKVLNNTREFASAITIAEMGMLSGSLLGILALAYVLIADISIVKNNAMSFDQSSSPVIASIKESKNTVKIKTASLPLWENAGKSEALRSKDRVFTGKNSSTNIRFSDKSEIKIGENAIVVIEKKENRNSLNLVKGAIYGKSSTKSTTMQVFVGGVKLAVSKNSEFLANRDSKGETSVTLLKGSGQIKSKQGESEIKTKQVAVLSKTGDVVKHELPIILEYPAPHSDMYFSKGEAVSFGWTKGTDVANYNLEISRDRSFQKILSSIKTKEPRYAMKDMKSGSYFWRVRSQKQGASDWKNSPAQKINVTEESPAVLAWPENNKKYSFPLSDENTGLITMLDWQNATTKDSATVEVAADRGFGDIVFSESVKKGPISTPKLPEGSYSWRVKSKTNSGKWIFSDTRRFVVASIGLPRTPLPIAPQNNYTVKIGNKEKKLALNFAWQEVSESKSYEWQSSSDDDFDEDDNLVTKVTNKSSVDSTFTEDGEYYWRVRSIDAYGRKTTFSKPQLLSMIRLPPVAEEPPDILSTLPLSVIDADESEIAVLLNWKPLEDERKRLFALQIAKDSRFTDIVDEDEVGSNSYSANLNQGRYYWRVSTITPGTSEKKWSKYRPFEVKKRPRFSAFSSPERDEKIVFLARSHETDVSWERVLEANSYTVQLSNDENFDSMVSENKYASNEATFDLKQGTYYMRLKTHGRNGIDSRWGDSSRFVLALAPKPKIIDSLSPSGEITNLYRKAIPKVDITFDEESQSSSYQLQIASNENFVDSETVSLDESVYSINPVDGSTYYRVRGVDKIGRQGSWSEPAKISSRKLETSPKLTYPEDNSLISGRLPEHEVEFRWDNMERVEDYTLEFSRDIAFLSLIEKKSTDEYSETVDISEPGVYYWRVKAHDPKENLAMISETRTVEVKLAPDFESSGLDIDEIYLEISAQPTIYTINFVSDGPELGFSGASVNSYGSEVGFSYRGVNFGLGGKRSTVELKGEELYDITSEEQGDLTMHFHEMYVMAAYLFNLSDIVVGPHFGFRQKVVPLLFRETLTTIGTRDVSQTITEAGVSAKTPLFLGIHGGIYATYGISSPSETISSSQQARILVFLHRIYESFYLDLSYQFGLDTVNYVSDEYEVDEQLNLQTHQGKVAVGKNF